MSMSIKLDKKSLKKKIKDNKACQIDVELALRDLMDIVCKYVHGKDLLNMAKVCKSWNFASLREQQKRYHIQQLRLLSNYDYSNVTSVVQFPYKIKCNLASVVHAKPEVSLFIREELETKSPRLIRGSVLDNFNKQLPNKMIVIGVDEYLTTEEDKQFQGASSHEGHCHLQRSNGDILGIFFPSGKPQIRIHVAWMESDYWILYGGYGRNAFWAKRLADDLSLNECEYPKSTVLLFMNYFNHSSPQNNFDSITEDFGKIIQQSGKEVTLSTIYALSLTSRCNTTERNENIHKRYVALRISGKTVESWSTFIHYRAQRDDIKCRLQALKQKVNKSKRYYIGLVCTPICDALGCSHIEHPCGNSRKIMYSLRRIFPDIRFTGFFINHARLHNYPREHHCFPDVFNENDAYNPDFLKRTYLYVSIIIISYD